LKVSLIQRLQGVTRARRAVKLVWDSARNWTLASSMLMLVQAVLPLVILYLIKLIVDAVALGVAAPDKQAVLGQVLVLIFLAGLATLFMAACRAAAGIVQEHQGQLVTDHVMEMIHGKSAEVDLAYYEDPRYHDTFYRAQQEAPYRPSSIVQSLSQLAQNSISLLALAGLLFFLHWAVALVLFAAVLPGIIVKVLHADRLYAWHSRRAETERRAYDYHRILTDVFHARELRLFDLGGLFRRRHKELRDELRRERLGLARTRAVHELMAQAGAILSIFFLLGFIAWQAVLGNITIGDMVMYHQAFQRAQSALKEILTGLARLYEDNLFLSHFYGFLDLKPAIARPDDPEPVPRPMRSGIRLHKVAFVYPGSSKEAVKDIDMRIEPGQVVALVGDNGAGKTTLAKLVSRLYDPVQGRITMDGIDYRRFDPVDLRREMAMIFQDYIQYPLTARENIWMGNVLINPDDEQVRQAAVQAGADRIISRLPMGYETMLGKRFQKGTDISIGEWQKIALSRAFVRQAQLVILDEPASSMSVRSEYEIFQSFKELLNGRSALLISHRFSTVRVADFIYVLDKGRIVEQGSHEELKRLGGLYASMYETQAGYFR
jgi:ATP-binding cassette, subfamily B, bacterial